MKRKLKLTNDDLNLPGAECKSLSNPEETIPNKEIEDLKTPKALTPEERKKVLKLFSKYFFIEIVSARANIFKSRIEALKSADSAFNEALLHAQNSYISYNMSLLDKYAKAKRDNDWRAIKYKLSIASKNFSETKFNRDDATKDRPNQAINIVINSKSLQISQTEALKTIGTEKSKPETVSLQLLKKLKPHTTNG